MSLRISRAAVIALLFVPALLAIGGCAGGSGKPSEPIPFSSASVTSIDNRTFNIGWSAPNVTAVAVYAGTDPAKIGRDQPVGADGTTGRVSVANLPPASRWYFQLSPDHGGSLIIADRSLNLASAPNFRDAGGYRTTDGRWVKMGLLYRSDQLDHLTPEDLATLHADGIHLVCDLRTDTERAQGKDRVPDGAESLIADVAGSDSSSSGIAKLLSDPRQAEAMLGGGKGVQFMIDANRKFVTAPSALKAYKAVFERLADPAMLPAVYHCTAGKDRTGWAQAIFLTIMGVPREAITQDYLLSNDTLRGKNERMLAMMRGGRIDPAWIKPLLDVRPEYLDAAFDEVSKRYGSMDNYLHQGLGLSDDTLNALRREFLAG